MKEEIFTIGKVARMSGVGIETIRFYVQQAIQHAASEEELGEFLAVGATMGGCVGEMWAIKAYKAYKDTTAGAGQDESCCQVEEQSRRQTSD